MDTGGGVSTDQLRFLQDMLNLTVVRERCTTIPTVIQGAITGKSRCPGFISITVIKYPDRKHLLGDWVHVSSQFQAAARHSRKNRW